MAARVSALVLAAGASRRMGTPKALLEIGGTSFLRRIATTLDAAGITDVAIVLGADAALIRPAIAEWFGGTIIENAVWEQGQLSSIHAGLDVLDPRGIDGAIVWPVDHPVVSPGVIADLVGAFAASGKGIILPVHDGRRGHPVLFSSRMFPHLRAASPRNGARDAIRSSPDEVCEVATADPGVLRNIDTPELFSRLSAEYASG